MNSKHRGWTGRSTTLFKTTLLSTLVTGVAAYLPPLALADGAPGAYLGGTNATQKASESLGNSGNNAAPGYSPPIQYAAPPPQNYQAPPQNYQPNYQPPQSYQAPPQSYQPPAQSMPATYGQFQQQSQSPTYSGAVQQSGYAPPVQQNYQAPSTPPGWQSDYPPMSEMPHPMGVTPMNAPMGAPMNAPMGGPMTNGPMAPMGPPLSAMGGSPMMVPPAPMGAPQGFQGAQTYNPNMAQPVPAAAVPITGKAQSDEPKEESGGDKALESIAKTVLPIATSVVVSGIMNKMMYGSVAPPVYGYPSGYGAYQGYGSPYGYGAPMMNPMMNPMGAPSLINGVGRMLGGMR